MLLKYTACVNWLNSCQSGNNLKVKNKNISDKRASDLLVLPFILPIWYSFFITRSSLLVLHYFLSFN